MTRDRMLTLSENFGVGISAAKDLNSGVTWRGELKSVFRKSHSAVAGPLFAFSSSQTGKVSEIIQSPRVSV